VAAAVVATGIAASVALRMSRNELSSRDPDETKRAAATPRPRAPRTRTSPSIDDAAPPPAASAVVETRIDAKAPEPAADHEAKLRVETPQVVYRVMERLIADAVRGGRAFNPAIAPESPTAPQPGTLAAAKRWCQAELTPQLWKTAAAELGVASDEFDKCWKTRDPSTTRRIAYGGGSFLVARRPPANSGKRGGPTVRPFTEEEWWTGASPDDRIAWLTANFVEVSGSFVVVEAAQKPCAGCGGDGRLRDGSLCAQCNGCGLVREIVYR